MPTQLHPQTLKFLSSLKKNNNKIWFDKNKASYEAIKDQLTEFAAAMIKEISKFDPTVADVNAKSTIFRIYRDIRFSKDKTPYKTNVGMGISKGGKNFPTGGYYIHLQPRTCFLGGGIWMPEPETLHEIRQEIDYNFEDFKKIVESKSFKKVFGKLDEGGKLTRPPKNYSPDNPAIEYLMLKSFTCGVAIPDKEVMSDKFLKKAASVFKEMYPFIQFLNEAIE